MLLRCDLVYARPVYIGLCPPPSHNDYRKYHKEIATFVPIYRRSCQPEPRIFTLRGLLVLDLVKPTKISSIEIELTAVTSTAWLEGALPPYVCC